MPRLALEFGQIRGGEFEGRSGESDDACKQIHGVAAKAMPEEPNGRRLTETVERTRAPWHSRPTTALMHVDRL